MFFMCFAVILTELKRFEIKNILSSNLFLIIWCRIMMDWISFDFFYLINKFSAIKSFGVLLLVLLLSPRATNT